MLMIGPNALRVNDQIRVPTVRLFYAVGESLGIKGVEEAKRLAADAGQDLIEVAPNVHPPVCKIMNFGKYLYKQKKLEQKQKSKQKRHEMKGIRLSLRTDVHDLETKIRKGQEFLKDGHSLKVTLIFKGREASHADLGFDKMNKMKDALKEMAKIDQEPKRQGYNLFMVLSPK
jgi:translation initiation factor IF-3